MQPTIAAELAAAHRADLLRSAAQQRRSHAARAGRQDGVMTPTFTSLRSALRPTTLRAALPALGLGRHHATASEVCCA